MKKLIFLFALLPILAHGQVVNVRSCAAQQLAPNLNASPSVLNCTSVAGSRGGGQMTTIFGTLLGTNPVNIPAPTGYVVSLDNINFANSQSVTPSGGAVNQPVYYALSSSNSAGTVNGSSTVTCGALSVTVTLNGTVTVAASFSLSPTTLTFTSVAGSNGSSNFFDITGVGLGSNNLGVAAPTGYEVSKDNSSFANSQTVTPSSGSVSQRIYGRLLSTNTPGTYNGVFTVSCPGAGLPNQTVTANGTTSSAVAADTLLVKIRDSAHGESLYTTNNTNNFSPTGTGAALTSAPLKYKTGVQSPITITVGGLNDIFSNANGLGSGNTLGLPVEAYHALAFSNPGTLSFTFNNVPNGNWVIKFLCSTNSTFSSSFSESVAIGGTSFPIEPLGNVNNWISIPVTVTTGTFTATFTPTGSNTLGMVDHITMINNH